MKENLFNLSGKVAIVTGAAGQLGGEYIKTLLNAGASVAAFDINFNNPKSTLKKLKSNKLLTVKTDITSKKSIEKGLNKVIRTLGYPSILINNAAIDNPPNSDGKDTGPFETYPEASWNKVMDVNLKGTIICCQVIGGNMAKNRGGSIINIASIYGILSPDQRIYEYKSPPFFKPIAYCASKAGVLNVTRYLATYWAKNNIRVNTLILGGVFNYQDGNFLENYCSKVPLGRMAQQDEYNGAMVFLASDASSYMTGSQIIIDGGFSAW